MFDRPTFLVPVALTLCAASCNVFDESLIPAEDTGGLRVGDRLVCTAGAVPLNESANDYRLVDISRAANDENAQPACVVRGLPSADLPEAPGADVYFQIDMIEGEKWHFHVKEREGVDPLIYVADRCDDTRSCVAGINACGPGRPEHFSFQATAAGTYFVGLDSLTEDSEPLEVFAVRAECGNGEAPQHSEFCDDQNDDPLDGCHQCRRALQNNGDDDAEGKNSFNDGPLDPTLLLLPPAQESGDAAFSFSVRGSLLNECDFDFFQFTLTKPWSVSASLIDAPAACRGADLQLNPSPASPFLVMSTASEDCPVLSAARVLSAGSHLVRVAARRTLETNAARYTLQLNFEPEAPP